MKKWGNGDLTLDLCSTWIETYFFKTVDANRQDNWDRSVWRRRPERTAQDSATKFRKCVFSQTLAKRKIIQHYRENNWKANIVAKIPWNEISLNFRENPNNYFRFNSSHPKFHRQCGKWPLPTHPPQLPCSVNTETAHDVFGNTEVRNLLSLLRLLVIEHYRALATRT